MNKQIYIQITPDHLYLTASQAAEQLSQDILRELPLMSRLKCYWKYIFEPAFIKEHLNSILEGAPFFIGTIFEIWNYLSTSLQKLESVNTIPPTKENLIRIISIPMDYAKAHDISIIGGCHLPPTLQKILLLLDYQNINRSEINDHSIEKAKRLLISTTKSLDMSSAVGSAYGNHNKSKHLAFAHLSAGHHQEGLYYGEQACNHLLHGFSLEETLITCDALMDKHSDNKSIYFNGIQEIKARIKFILGEYKFALKVYISLTNSEVSKTRYESMRKVVRCYERLGKYSKAIEIGNSFLPQINDQYYKAKMQRVLGWTYIQLGESSSLEKSLELSNSAKTYFESINNNDARYNLARTYNNLGVIHEQLAEKPDSNKAKELLSASKNHSKCKKIMHQLGSLRWESASLLNASIVQRKNNELNSSLKQATEAIRIKTWICDFDELPICQYNIAFTHIKMYFTHKDSKSIREALDNINQALEIRQKQTSSKRTIPLLCLKALCEIIQNPTIKDSKAMKHLLEAEELPEDDKVPLLHKVLASIYLTQKGIVPSTLDRFSEEQELPLPNKILEYIHEG